MVQKSFLLVVFIVFTGLLVVGQSFLYPAKVNHKWGYIDRRGNIQIEPRIDIINFSDLVPINSTSKLPPKTGFRLIQIDGKVGVLNARHQIIIPPSYQWIYLINNDYFAAHKEQHIEIIDNEGIVLFSGSYQQVKYLGKSSYSNKVFFQVRQDSLWGIHQALGDLVVPMQFKSLSFLDVGQGHFLTQFEPNAKKKSIINVHGSTVITSNFDSIKACANNLIAYYSSKVGNWGVMDTLGTKISEPIWSKVIPLNSHWLGVTLRKDTSTLLYAIEKKEILDLKIKFQSLKKLDDKYILYRTSNRFGLWDATGKAITDAIFFDVEPYSTYSYYKILGRGGWGIYDINAQRQVLPYVYQDIELFKGNYAMVTRLGKKGIINRSFEEIIPANYDTIYVQGNVFRAVSGLEADVYETNEAGKIIDFEQHKETNTIQVKKRILTDFVHATPLSSTKYNYDPVFYPDVYPSPKFPNWSNWKLKPNGYFFSSHHQQNIPFPSLRRILYTENHQLALISNDTCFVKGSTSKLMALLPKAKYHVIEIFEHQTGTRISNTAYLGIRRHDFERGLPVAAVVDTNGYMGLVHKNGQAFYHEGKPFRTTYIGEFEDGWARFCVGGTFRKIKAEDNDRFTVELASEFWKKFLFDAKLAADSQQKEDETEYSGPKEATWIIESTTDNPAKWGFIHYSGKIGVPAQYQFAKDMKLGQAEVVENGNWGIIDTANQIVIPCEYAFVSPYYGAWKVNQRHNNNIIFNLNGHQVKYNNYLTVTPFQNGFASVQSNQGWGIINEAGQEIIPSNQIAVGSYSEGLIAVQNENGWHFTDSLGKVIIPANILAGKEKFGNFHNNKCWFTSSGRYGYIDRTGSVVIEPTFQLAFDFQNNIARAVKGGKTGLINENGVWILEPKRFDIVEPFDENGLAVVLDNYQSRKKGLLRQDGKLLLIPYYQSISAFSEGFAIVRSGNQYGYVNMEGKVVIPCVYSYAKPFSEGLAAVKNDDQGDWQYIDTLGKIAFPYKFELADAFHQGKAFVQVNMDEPSSKYILTQRGKLVPTKANFFSQGLFGFHDDYSPVYKQGFYYGDEARQNIWKQYFSVIQPFKGEYAMVEQGSKKGIIHRNGLFSLLPKYIAMEKLDENHVKVLPPAFGIIDRTGKVVLPPIFDRITLYAGNVYQVEQGEKIGYTDLKGKWFWELKN